MILQDRLNTTTTDCRMLYALTNIHFPMPTTLAFLAVGFCYFDSQFFEIHFNRCTEPHVYFT